MSKTKLTVLIEKYQQQVREINTEIESADEAVSVLKIQAMTIETVIDDLKLVGKRNNKQE